LRVRRERVDTPEPAPIPSELSRWIARAKAMRVGDRMEMNANTKSPYPVTLVWVGENFNPYVFADMQGQKSASLTLQQMAMYLRRGLIRSVLDEGDNAVERAMVGVVNRLHEAVAEEAAHDDQTGLQNRRAFIQAIETALAQQSSGAALAQISLENLKAVNDAHGVEVGDQLIKQLSDTLQHRFDKLPVVLGRMGGSEWGVFWSRGGLQPAYREVQALLEKLSSNELIVRDGVTVIPKLIAGMAGIDDELMNVEALVAAVNEACSTARAQTNQPIYVAGRDSRQRKQLEQMIGYVEKALSRERLALLFNEVRSLNNTGRPAARIVASAEDRNGKMISPGLFSQAVVASAHAFEIDSWTLKYTLRWMAMHTDELERFSAFIVPLSRASLAKDDLANLVVNELMESAVPPARVCFEIADKDAISKLNETADLINTLREFGCQFVLAEFGGGQTNYEYLKELAVDFVCIQSSFILDGRQDPKDLAMARSINELAHFMGKLTIGKLDSDPAILDMLREMKVDFVHDITRSTRLVFDTNG
jgi:diguanylate cyclase (GGDEF)-like protein